MQNTARRSKITVSADGRGLVSQAGALLLAETARVTGLGESLAGGLGRWRRPRAVHDPGKMIADLVMALALGGDCLADVAVLRAQPELAGPVASDPVMSRLVSALAADAPGALRAIRAARAAARDRAWALAGDRAPGAGGSPILVDLDATIVLAHSEKQNAAPTWKKTFGFHPLAAFADHGAGAGGEPLAIMLRPGNAASNTASEHVEVTRLALAQLPRRARRRVLIRTDSGGGTHEFVAWLARRRRPGPPGRLGRRAHRPARPGPLARGDAGDRPQGMPPPRRPAAVHRPRRAPLHLLRHQHPPQSARRPRTAPPPPRPLRRPHPSPGVVSLLHDVG